MNYEYTLALMLTEGSDAPLLAYMDTMEKQFGFAYPLPPLIPLGGYDNFFPPDRVDRQKLKELPGLSFSRIVKESEGLVLSLSVPELGEAADLCLRGIHGQEKPIPLPRPLFPWKGLLLHPEGFPRSSGQREDYPVPPEITWQTYRLVLLKMRWKENTPWWNEIHWEVLWNIRKPRRNKNT